MVGSFRLVILLIFATSFLSCTKGIDIRLNHIKTFEVLKKIRDTQVKYKDGFGKGKYGSQEELIKSSLLDQSELDPKRIGYVIEIRSNNTTYTVLAKPLRYDETGKKGGTGSFSFYLDETGVIRMADKLGGEANKEDEPISEKKIN